MISTVPHSGACPLWPGDTWLLACLSGGLALGPCLLPALHTWGPNSPDLLRNEMVLSGRSVGRGGRRGRREIQVTESLEASERVCTSSAGKKNLCRDGPAFPVLSLLPSTFYLKVKAIRRLPSW